MKRLMIILVAAFGLGTAHAATLQTDADVRAFADRVMAKDQHIGLRAMHQRERHARVRRVEQRALAFDDIPVIRRGRR